MKIGDLFIFRYYRAEGQENPEIKICRVVDEFKDVDDSGKPKFVVRDEERQNYVITENGHVISRVKTFLNRKRSTQRNSK